MSFAMMTNIATTFFCLAVLVQSMRMMRSLKAVKSGDMAAFITALDKATGEARGVLNEMKATLASECAPNLRTIEEGRAIRDELSMLVSIADATAERLVGAASNANGTPAGFAKDEGMATKPADADADGYDDAAAMAEAERILAKLGQAAA